MATSDILLELPDLLILSDSDCMAAGVETDLKLVPDMVCAEGQGGKDSCKVGMDWIINSLKVL